jgi:hypothetical protein
VCENVCVCVNMCVGRWGWGGGCKWVYVGVRVLVCGCVCLRIFCNIILYSVYCKRQKKGTSRYHILVQGSVRLLFLDAPKWTAILHVEY